MNNQEAAEMIRDDIRRHHDQLSGKYRHALNMAIDALRAQDHEVDIRDVPGMWCDDITFCPEECEIKTCPRNSKNIRDRTVPHSFFMEKPDDCLRERYRCELDEEDIARVKMYHEHWEALKKALKKGKT